MELGWVMERRKFTREFNTPSCRTSRSAASRVFKTPDTRADRVCFRLLRAYAAQVEALLRLRNGGSQIVRVEHVHVHEGGQAVIGNAKSTS
jgi:hypothetical protein